MDAGLRNYCPAITPPLCNEPPLRCVFLAHIVAIFLLLPHAVHLLTAAKGLDEPLFTDRWRESEVSYWRFGIWNS